MRTVRWGVVVIMCVGAAAAWLVRAPEPQPPVPVAESAPVTGAPVEPAPSADASAPAPGDAAVSAEEVRFVLLRDGGQVVGERVTLRQGREEVGGTLNVMGMLTLPLPAGEWHVSAPRSVSPDVVRVPTDGGVVTLTLAPERAIDGCVVDEAQQPVAARVFVRSGGQLRQTFTGRRGCFTERVAGAEAEVWAETFDGRSLTKHVEVPGRVVLELVPLVSLWVELKPEGLEDPRLSVSHRLGVTQVACERECHVKVPVGDYALLASGVRQGALLFARHEGTAASRGSDVQVVLAPAPVISGVVRTDAGVALPNVPLRFVAVGNTGELARTLTRDDGSFVVEPRLTGGGREQPFPAWTISTEPPWQLSPAVVSLGDAPLVLTAAMNTP